ncbi:MAG: phosphotransferase [Planctomycetota bacterium]
MPQAAESAGPAREIDRPVGQDGREKYGTEELATVLSHYDLGVIQRMREFNRGSRKAPKLQIDTDTGRFLLKRRARGRDDPFKVAFCHALQLHLADKQFPLPHLIGTRRDNNSMLQWEGAIYEMFEYIPGSGYPQTLEATYDSGRVQAVYHTLLDSFSAQWEPPRGSYHEAPAVRKGLGTIAEAMRGKKDVRASCKFLADSYAEAATFVNDAGLAGWADQIVHGDWHPGNMLFHEDHVVAVIDYDSARKLPRIIDTANGALQFSILGGGDDVSKWPSHIDQSRFKRFLRGYDAVAQLSTAELRVIPALMIEALIAEAVFPIAATGQFGRLEGGAFLNMVVSKIQWLQKSTDDLVAMVAD